MRATLADLFAEERFHLRLVVEPRDTALLQQPITWAHSSDLPDPTPWLEEGQLLLTDGTHFVQHTDEAFARDYAARLVSKRVLALGFATQVIHDAVPPTLIAACRRAGLPLIEVAERTPFMAIIRHVADSREAEQRQRLEFLLEAHRAVARAALQPGGLEAILGELERRLDTWITLFDAAGNAFRTSARRTMPAGLAGAVEQEVRAALGKGLRTSIRFDSPSGFTVQTIGRRGALRAALVVGTAEPLDRSGTELLTSVIAMASIALEQTNALAGARDALRRALLELLLSGEREVARRTASQLDIAVPKEGPIRAMVTPGTGSLDELAAVVARFGGFVAERGGEFVVLVTDGRADDAARAVAAQHRAVAVSAAVPWADAATALQQAQQLQVDEQPPGRIRTFEALSAAGLMGVLRRGDGTLVAGTLLRPVLDSEEGRRLLDNARVWFRHNGAYDPAARELGIHRHTLRARMDTLGTAVGLDLDRFADRAELHSAMELLHL